MSGIAGIVHLDGGFVTVQELKPLLDRIAPRGPEGINHHLDGCAGLGHSLLRTGKAADDARVLTLDGHCWITADARIDGQGELRRALEAAGDPPLPEASDAELILRSYRV